MVGREGGDGLEVGASVLFYASSELVAITET
jgi:hypothetical protein